MASPTATGGADPSRSYRWQWLVEKDTSYLSLNNLPAGLKLEDFVVRVDGRRRLTITGRHKKPTPGGEAPAPRLKETFQFKLPKTANPDAITGCFDGGKLTLTVPSSGRKRTQQPAAATIAAAKEEEPKAKAEREKKLIDTAAVTVAAAEEEEKQEGPKAKVEREKKLIDTAVAAFTLGVLFSHRLFSSSSN